MQLHEKYRPSQLSEVIAQPKAVSMLSGLFKRGLGGKAFFITGKSGTGKTTLAKIIASEIAESWNTRELDATTLYPSHLQEIESNFRYYGMGAKDGHCLIVNECHGLRKDTIRQFLVVLERIPDHCCIIFTTTLEGSDMLFEDYGDANPLVSRCIEIKLQQRDLTKPMAERVKQIAMSEGLDGQPIEKYIKLAQDSKNNMRRMLQQVDSGIMMEVN